MSTLTVPLARPRPARWVFRLHRWALYVWAALVLLCSTLLVWAAGPLADRATRGWHQVLECPRRGPCTVDVGFYYTVFDLVSYAMIVLPFLVAAWAAVTLTAPGTESGSAPSAWLQGITPARWLAARLAFPAAVITAGAGLLVVLHRYAWAAPEDRQGPRPEWWMPRAFYTNGPTLVAACLAALAAGALTGLLVRRTLPSLGITLAATALLYGGVHRLMPHLWPLVTKVNDFQHGYAVRPGALEVVHGIATRGGGRVPAPACTVDSAEALAACERLYARHGGTGYFTQYHPASHYWPLQLTTTALLLLLTALLTAAAFAVLRRRTG
ncbi:hypothetical protein [Streptomyces sp. LaPpAH-108]|uniref:hypothetical protein n=1 Tax=Streptomyces sp. LaPpAH-108 TaxID=1155714 RepID=UPI000382E541|nr:hypothetical protein [Streptomyces sp. LaPpAH-108]